MKILCGVFIFSLIIIVHELGHFLLAKKNGIGVVEFSLGMGPRIISVTRKNTKYSLKLFPIGGACMMVGEDEVNEATNSFEQKSVWARISVIAAGPLFNIVLAFLLSIIVIGMIGYDPAKVADISEGGVAQEAGLKAGDIILNVDGTAINTSRELVSYWYFSPVNSKEISLKIDRGDTIKDITISPILDNKGTYQVDFTMDSSRTKRIATTGKAMTAGDILKYSAIEVKFWIVTAIESVVHLVKGRAAWKEITGPIGIVNWIGSNVQNTQPYGIGAVLLQMAYISIMLSVNLGIMNLLPLPALDGGRLTFLFLEVIRRKRVNLEKEGLIHGVGLVFLMIMMIVVMFHDITKI